MSDITKLAIEQEVAAFKKHRLGQIERLKVRLAARQQQIAALEAEIAGAEAEIAPRVLRRLKRAGFQVGDVTVTVPPGTLKVEGK